MSRWRRDRPATARAVTEVSGWGQPPRHRPFAGGPRSVVGRRLPEVGRPGQEVSILAGDDVDPATGRLLTVAELQEALQAALAVHAQRLPRHPVTGVAPHRRRRLPVRILPVGTLPVSHPLEQPAAGWQPPARRYSASCRSAAPTAASLSAAASATASRLLPRWRLGLLRQRCMGYRRGRRNRRRRGDCGGR